MKKHQAPIILLFLAVIAFVMRFFVVEEYENYCDIAAFALPMVATLFEIILSVKNDKEDASRDAKIKDHENSLTWN